MITVWNWVDFINNYCEYLFFCFGYGFVFVFVFSLLTWMFLNVHHKVLADFRSLYICISICCFLFSMGTCYTRAVCPTFVLCGNSQMEGAHIWGLRRKPHSPQNSLHCVSSRVFLLPLNTACWVFFCFHCPSSPFLYFIVLHWGCVCVKKIYVRLWCFLFVLIGDMGHPDVLMTIKSEREKAAKGK